MRLLHVVLLCLLSVSTSAYAQTGSGSVTLTVTAADFRINPYATAANSNLVVSPAGARQTNRFRDPGTGAASLVPLRRALVVFTINQNGSALVRCARTNDSGQVTFAWSSTLPATATLEVRPIAFGSAPPPATCSNSNPEFTITTGATVPGGIPIVLSSSSFNLSTGVVNRTTTVGTGLGSLFQEAVSAYLTSLETLEMQDTNDMPFAGTQSIRSSVAGFTVFINDSNLNTAPTFDRIITSTNRTTLRPTTMAHEIGHLVAWNNLDLTLAVINPAVDYSCHGNPDPPLSWSRATQECTKVVFHEGFGDLHAGLWMWHRTAPDSPVLAISFPNAQSPNRGVGADLFLEDNTGPGDDVGCGDFSASVRHRHTACLTAALWDIVDAPPTGGDSINAADLSDLVGALRSYRDDLFCIWPNDNRCKNEGYLTPAHDPDGNNWKDFKAAAAASPNITATQLNGIENSLSLGGTPDD